MTAPLTDDELQVIATWADERTRNPAPYPSAAPLVARAVAELRESRALDEEMRKAMDTLEAMIVNGGKGPERQLCGHCRLEVPLDDMPAHIRACDRNPMAAELRAAHATIATLTKVAERIVGLERERDAARCCREWAIARQHHIDCPLMTKDAYERSVRASAEVERLRAALSALADARVEYHHDDDDYGPINLVAAIDDCLIAVGIDILPRLERQFVNRR